MAEQRYDAVLAVIREGRTVKDVAAAVGVSRQTLHAWLARYEDAGLAGLADRSHRPLSCPHQMPAEVEAVVLELRRVRRTWGPRRIAFEVSRRPGMSASESAVYRCLVRPGRWSRTGVVVAGGCGSGGSAAGRWSCGRWISSAAS